MQDIINSELPMQVPLFQVIHYLNNLFFCDQLEELPLIPMHTPNKELNYFVAMIGESFKLNLRDELLLERAIDIYERSIKAN